MLSFKVKNSLLKIKIIFEIFWKEFLNLLKLDKDFLLFILNKIGGYWDISEINKRDYFSKWFKNVVKDYFGFGKNYGLYSFRYIFIIELYCFFVVEFFFF